MLVRFILNKRYLMLSKKSRNYDMLIRGTTKVQIEIGGMNMGKVKVSIQVRVRCRIRVRSWYRFVLVHCLA